MFDSLSKSVNSEWRLIKAQDNPGAILRRLPCLLDALKTSKETSTFYLQITEADNARKKEMVEAVEQSMEWVKEGFTELKKCRHSAYAQQEIHEFKGLLLGQGMSLGTRSIDRALEILFEAVSRLVEFGDSSVLQKITDEDGAPCFVAEEFVEWVKLGSDYIVKGAIKPKSKVGAQLIQCFRGGFVSAQFCPEVQMYQVTRRRIAISRYPSCVKRATAGMTREAKRTYQEQLKSDPIMLLAYLQKLSLYPKVDPLSLRRVRDKPPESWQEGDSVSTHALVGYELSSFTTSDASKRLHLCQKLQNSVEIFLSMVQADIACRDINSKQKQSCKKAFKQNSDEVTVKDFIMRIRRKDPSLSRDTVVSQILVAVAKEQLKIERQYQPSTYKRWDREIDQVKDMEKKLRRPKTKNR